MKKSFMYYYSTIIITLATAMVFWDLLKFGDEDSFYGFIMFLPIAVWLVRIGIKLENDEM